MASGANPIGFELSQSSKVMSGNCSLFVEASRGHCWDCEEHLIDETDPNRVLTTLSSSSVVLFEDSAEQLDRGKREDEVQQGEEEEGRL